jgi:voltage-gated sodium channel
MLASITRHPSKSSKSSKASSAQAAEIGDAENILASNELVQLPGSVVPEEDKVATNRGLTGLSLPTFLAEDDDRTQPKSGSKTEVFESRVSRFANERMASSLSSEPEHTGFAAIANDSRFQNFTLFVILLNALWIGVDTEWNHKNLIDGEPKGTKPKLYPVADIIENVFCVYFTVEVLIRFIAFERKSMCFRDGWFVFDSFLVFCMILETWIIAILNTLSGSDGGPDFLSNFSALRLLRLLRLTRMMRVMRQVPELTILVKGILSAAQAVGFIMIFLVGVTYVYAIIFTTQIAKVGGTPEEGSAEELFDSIGHSMMTLFTNGVLGDNLADTVDAIVKHSNLSVWLFFSFFGISSMTLLNMLIGVLCEVVGMTQEGESKVMEEDNLRYAIETCFADIDINHDGRVSEAEWQRIKQDEDVKRAFIESGLDEGIVDEELDQMQVAIFGKGRGDKGLTLDQLVQRVIEIRPGMPGSLIEMKVLEAKHAVKVERLYQEVEDLEKEFEEALLEVKPQANSNSYTAASIQAVPTAELLECFRARSQQSNSQCLQKPESVELRLQSPNVSESSLVLIQEGLGTEKKALAPSAPGAHQAGFKRLPHSGKDETSPLGSSIVTDHMLSADFSNLDERERANTSSEHSGIMSPIDAQQLQENRKIAKQHPLFACLSGRANSSGWILARQVAERLQPHRLSITELSRQLNYSVGQLSDVLLALPEIFNIIGTMVELRCPPNTLVGCPTRSPGNYMAFHECTCVSRICDALQHFGDCPDDQSLAWRHNIEEAAG